MDLVIGVRFVINRDYEIEFRVLIMWFWIVCFFENINEWVIW